MQQAMRNKRPRGSGCYLEVFRKRIRVAGALAGELMALASMATALAAGLLVLTALLAA